MNQRVSAWLTELESLTRRYTDSFGHLTAGQLNWRSAPERWSVGQIIDHVIRTNESYYPILDQLDRGEYKPSFAASMPFVPGILGAMILKSVEPQQTRKSKTMPLWLPSQSDIAPDIVSRFSRHQRELADRISFTSQHIKQGTVIGSPANRHIVYRLGTAFDIIIAHEKRHFNQAAVVYRLQSTTS